ncbi:MAG: rhodanese-like domain-containing protein [Bdellovibrionales bacterium]|nr:rhodanese-like domain-containing protein [Bdellovibrionales bacterium]
MKFLVLFLFVFVAPLSTWAFENSITPEKGVELVKTKKAIVLDVREADELTSGMAEPARWVPTSSFRSNGPEWKKFLGEMASQKDTPVVVYCAVGGRASTIVRSLRKQGYTAYNMGGFRDWKAAGLPVKNP